MSDGPPPAWASTTETRLQAGATGAPTETREDPTARSRGVRHQPVSSRDLALVALVAVAGGLLAAFVSSAAPTDTGWIDALERGAAVVAVAVAASRARRWTLVFASMVVTVASPWPLLAVGLVALAVTVFLVESRIRSRVLGAAVGAAVALLSLGLAVPGPTGIETMLALVATVPVAVSGYRQSAGSTRQVLRRGLLLSAMLIVVSLGLTAFAGATAMDRVDDAIDLTDQAVAAAQAGTGTESAELFAEANDAFSDAASTIGSIWASGPRFIPVVGANLAAVQRAVAAGEELTEAGASLVSGAEFADVQLAGGGVDLVALEALTPRVVGASDALKVAQATIGDADSVWLIGPLASRLDRVDERLAETAGSAEDAAVAVEGLPVMLGAQGPRRYLFLLANPAEARDLGGHVGNWAEVVADGGRIELVAVGGPEDLSLPELSDDLADDYPASFTSMDPARFPQNLSATLDLGVATEYAADLFEQRFGRRVDTVAYADTGTFAALLELSGPVAVPGLDGFEITSDNAVEFLTRDQFVRFDSEAASSAALEDVIRVVFDRLTSTKLPGPERLGEIFSPLVRDGRLRMDSLHEGDEAMLRYFGLPRAVPQPDGHDVLAVLNRNAGPSKIDSYLHRDTTVDIGWDPLTGAVESRVDVRMRNTAPEGGVNAIIGGSRSEAEPGSNVTDLVVVTPFRVDRIAVDGIPQAPRSLFEGGLWRHSVRVAVPPGGALEVSFDLQGRVEPSGEYELSYLGQPLVNPGVVSLHMKPTSGTLASGDAGTDVSGREVTKLAQNPDALVEWRLEGYR